MSNPDAIEDELREQVRAWIAAGHTQSELAERAGIRQQTVSEWLTGQYGTRLVIGSRIAAAIGRPLKLGGRKR